jgi:hypothetical protein
MGRVFYGGAGRIFDDLDPQLAAAKEQHKTTAEELQEEPAV